ncbi:MAG: UDP-N-acetylglucosamine 2-epimerase (non-hydrolyzing) [Burkholderiales bacterium]|nr:UDP-N-acetylglucosamine 2-epimerase (non-hydrolyzing) [Burkholderiales bacterium]
MRIAIVQGTRPEIIKNFPLVRALSAAHVPFEVLHTNQHSTAAMSGDVYDEMGYAPDRCLAEPYRLGSAINWLQSVLVHDHIDHVIVNGDTAASLAGAVSAIYLGIAVTHIEAGLRSGDRIMLEERNRITVDSLSTLLFAYTDYERSALSRSPDVRGTVFVEGNTSVDVLDALSSRIDHAAVCEAPYLFVTMHRKEFTDSPGRMASVFEELARIAASTCPVVFPVHPRTADAMRRHGISRRTLGPVRVLDPVGAIESLALQKSASAVLTDSGCVQEEAYLLNVPCITIRDNTERHLTVLNGANVVTGFIPQRIRDAVNRALAEPTGPWPEIYGAPGVGNRIVHRMLEHLQPGMQPKMDAGSLSRTGTVMPYPECCERQDR